jgi:hypothetical protein
MLKVKNHKEFCFFEYESETSPTYQLGDVLTKDYSKLYEDSEPDNVEVGVVIQTFDDGEFRTDMWGMSSVSEVSPSTILEIKKYRPKLMESLLIS